MKAGIVVFPGSNCDRDMELAFKEALGLETVMLWHKDTDLQGVDIVGLPGGFSYGDYLRSGAIAQFSPIMKEVINFANKGGKVLGICNGFQVLTECHLLEGALLKSKTQKFTCKNAFITFTGNDLYRNGIQKGKAFKIPVANSEGRFVAKEDTLKQLEDEGRILYKYCDQTGEISEQANYNGSANNIASICNKQGNIVGMMPHPERAAFSFLGNTDGLHVLESLLNLIHS